MQRVGGDLRVTGKIAGKRLFSKSSASSSMFVFHVCLVLYIHTRFYSTRQEEICDSVCLKKKKKVTIMQIK